MLESLRLVSAFIKGFPHMQSSTYLFDPTAWTTITSLFEALSVVPVADGVFMDWLAQWNNLEIAV